MFIGTRFASGLTFDGRVPAVFAQALFLSHPPLVGIVCSLPFFRIGGLALGAAVLPLVLLGCFVPHSGLGSGSGSLWRLVRRCFCGRLFSGRLTTFLLFYLEGTLGDIPFYTAFARVGGGTVQRAPIGQRVVCLSPRGRGNLPHMGGLCTGSLSIPAWAGEPLLGNTGSYRLSRRPITGI